MLDSIGKGHFRCLISATTSSMSTRAETTVCNPLIRQKPQRRSQRLGIEGLSVNLQKRKASAFAEALTPIGHSQSTYPNCRPNSLMSQLKTSQIVAAWRMTQEIPRLFAIPDSLTPGGSLGESRSAPSTYCWSHCQDSPRSNSRVCTARKSLLSVVHVVVNSYPLNRGESPLNSSTRVAGSGLSGSNAHDVRAFAWSDAFYTARRERK